MTDLIIQGANEFLYVYVTRTLECVGTGDAANKTFTTAKMPIADRDLDGTVGTADVDAYVGDALRTNMAAATVSSVTAATGQVTLSAAPANGKKVYVTYQYVLGYATYIQEYSISTDLDTKSITPLSSTSEEVIEVAWKYEGSVKQWDANELERDLLNGVDQTNDTVGGTYAKEFPVPVPTHTLIFKKTRGVNKVYKCLQTAKITSYEESGQGGEIGEKDFKVSAKKFIDQYVPPVGSPLA